MTYKDFAIWSLVSLLVYALWQWGRLLKKGWGWKSLIDSAEHEKRVRVYYQSIVYDICNILDRTGRFRSRTVCGTFGAPSKEVHQRIETIITDHLKMGQALDKFTAEVNRMSSALHDISRKIRQNIAAEIERQNGMLNQLTDPIDPSISYGSAHHGRHDAFVVDICRMIRDPERNWLNS